MDSYTGRLPLDFISVYLGMATEAQDAANIASENNFNEETRSRAPADNNQPIDRPPSNFSTSIEATEESLSTYAEKAVKAIFARDSPVIASLLPPLTERTKETLGSEASESDERTIRPKTAN